MDIFRIAYLLLAKKITKTVKTNDYFILSRLTENSGRVYESVAIHKNDFFSEIANSRVEVIALSCSDLTTPIVVGNPVAYYDFDSDFTATDVIASLLTPQSAGAIFTVNVYKNGSTILSTLVTINNAHRSSLTASIKAVLSTTTFIKGDRLTVGVSQVGNGTAAGLILQLLGNKTSN